MRRIILSSLTALSLWNGSAAAATVWNESVSGDLSNNNLAPTSVTFAPGVNSVLGVMGRDELTDPLDRDIFTFTIAPGQQLTAINVITFDPSGLSFYAIAPGTSINDTNPATHLANTLVRGLDDILAQMVAGSYSGGTGITDPLGPGTYTAWFQEGSSIVTYRMDYVVSAPEPSHGLLLLAGIGGMICRRSRRWCQA